MVASSESIELSLRVSAGAFLTAAFEQPVMAGPPAKPTLWSDFHRQSRIFGAVLAQARFPVKCSVWATARRQAIRDQRDFISSYLVFVVGGMSSKTSACAGNWWRKLVPKLGIEESSALRNRQTRTGSGAQTIYPR